MVTLQIRIPLRHGYILVINVPIEGIHFYFMIKRVQSLSALIIFIVCH